MPLNACGWSFQDDEKLVELVQPHTYLYNIQDPSRKNILAREKTWEEIALSLNKPVEECKKRWRGLRDGYMRSRRVGAIHKTKAGINGKLQFLDSLCSDSDEVMEEVLELEANDMSDAMVGTEQVITDNQEYYEITVVDDSQREQTDSRVFMKILPKQEINERAPKKTIKKTVGRKKASTPVVRNITAARNITTTPIKILPKPLLMSTGPKILGYVEDHKISEQRSQVIDKLIEKILKENTNEIDVFFRSMAASVKKLQPNLIPKVKMEVCNVIAKYEMQSFDRHNMS